MRRAALSGIVATFGALGAFGAACASGGAGGTAAYRQDVGIASEADAHDLVRMIVDRFQYQVLRDEVGSDALRIETYWRSRTPFDDERAQGIVAADSRLVIEGRARGYRDAGGIVDAAPPAPHYALRLAVDNRVRTRRGEGWDETVNTPMFHAYADDIARAFRDELLTLGVRR